MNLAEIRKKAQQARQEEQGQPSRPAPQPGGSTLRDAAPPVADAGPAVSPLAASPRASETAPPAAAIPPLAAEVVADFNSIELTPFVHEETGPPVTDEPARLSAEAPLNMASAANVTPEVTLAQPPPTTVESFVAAAPAVLPTAASQQNRGFDPLAILLAGREMAGLGDAEDFAGGTDVAEAIDDDAEEYLCFRVANEKYAINIMSIKEIIKPREETEVPRMPTFVTGIISLRGVIIPIIDMRLRLGLPTGAQAGKERVVVLKSDDSFCGVLVDEVVQVVRLRVSAIEQPPAVLEGIDREFVQGIGRFDDRMLILLNLGCILDLSLR
jgi:purine-binding chemotaxis protein CheW